MFHMIGYVEAFPWNFLLSKAWGILQSVEIHMIGQAGGHDAWIARGDSGLVVKHKVGG